MDLKMNFKSTKDRVPIMIINLYILIALGLYIFGPVKFHCDASIWMIFYMLLFLLFINMTYFIALNNYKYIDKSTTRKKAIENYNFDKPLPLWFQTVGLLIPVFMVITSIILSGFSGIQGGLANRMAEAYAFTQGGGVLQEGIDIPMWIYMHCAIFVYLSIIDGLVYFKSNNLIRRVIWGLTVLMLVMYFVLFKGTQKTLGDVFVLVASSILIYMYKGKSYKKINKKIILLLSILVITFAIILASVMGGRISYLNSMGYDAFKLHTQFWDVDLDSPLLFFVSDEIKIGFACLVFYLCNGLCGLAFCLKTSPTWSCGVGAFADLSDILARRLGIDFYQSTYVYKAYEEFGWHHSEQWHTIFPWIASDWTFLGAMLIMAVFAYIYAICWEEIINGVYKESLYLFCMLNIMWIYLPANNQIMATRTTSLIFIICLYMWFRRKSSGIRKRLFYERK